MATSRIMVELRVPRGLAADAIYSLAEQELQAPGFQLDREYSPVTVQPRPEISGELAAANEETVLVRATVDEAHRAESELGRAPRVVGVWSDARIEPFGASAKPSATDLTMGS